LSEEVACWQKISNQRKTFSRRRLHRPKVTNYVIQSSVVFDKNRTGVVSTAFLGKVIDLSRHIKTEWQILLSQSVKMSAQMRLVTQAHKPAKPIKRTRGRSNKGIFLKLTQLVCPYGIQQSSTSYFAYKEAFVWARNKSGDNNDTLTASFNCYYEDLTIEPQRNQGCVAFTVWHSSK
jgi:hypothetical protein